MELGKAGWYTADGGTPLVAAVGADLGVSVGQGTPLEVAVTRVEERLGVNTVRTSLEEI